MAKLDLFSKDFTKQLEKEIRKSVEKEAKKHPEKLLDSHVHKPLAEKCPRCGRAQLVIQRGGYARCTECGYTGKVSVNVVWG